MNLPYVNMTIGNGMTINGQEVIAGETIGLQPVGDGVTAVTLTLYSDNLTIDWENIPRRANIIAPDEIMDNQQRLADAADAEGGE